MDLFVHATDKQIFFEGPGNDNQITIQIQTHTHKRNI